MWYHVWCEGAKNHFVFSGLVECLKKDLDERFKGRVLDTGKYGPPNYVGHGVEKVEECKGPWFDLPGMIMTSRSHEKVTIDGGELEVASENFEYLFNELMEAQERTFADGKKYYKVHGWLHCIVFTPEQRRLILTHMQEQLPRVKAVAAAENKSFMDAISEINKDGLKVVTSKAPESVKALEKRTVLSGRPTNDKN
ncbi:MAG: hypothetical protein ACYDHY_07050 [Acidiferrobacterales bacterium]